MEFISCLIVLVLLPLSQSQSDTTFFNYNYNFNKDDPNLIFQGDAHVHPLQRYPELTAADYNYTGIFPFPLFPLPLPNSAGRMVYSRPIRLWDRAGRRQANFQTHFESHLWNFWSTDDMGDGISFFITPVNNTSTIPAGGHMGIYDSSGSSPTPLFAVELDPFVNSWDPSYRHVGININSRTSVAVERWDILTNMEGGQVTITYDATATLLTVNVAADRLNTTVQHVFDLKTLLPEWVQIGFSASTPNTVAALHEIRTWTFVSFLLPEPSITINDS